MTPKLFSDTSAGEELLDKSVLYPTLRADLAFGIDVNTGEVNIIQNAPRIMILAFFSIATECVMASVGSYCNLYP